MTEHYAASPLWSKNRHSGFALFVLSNGLCSERSLLFRNVNPKVELLQPFSCSRILRMPQLAGITGSNVALALVGLSDLLSRLGLVGTRHQGVVCPVQPVHELVSAVRSLEEHFREQPVCLREEQADVVTEAESRRYAEYVVPAASALLGQLAYGVSAGVLSCLCRCLRNAGRQTRRQDREAEGPPGARRRGGGVLC